MKTKRHLPRRSGGGGRKACLTLILALALDPARQWLTTVKDAVKIPPSRTTRRRIAILEEKVQPVELYRLMEWIMGRLDQMHRSV